MKNRKIMRRTFQDSLYCKPMTASSNSRFNIKFDFTQSNLSCFIDQKRQNKKTLSKRSTSHKNRKSSQNKKPTLTIKQQQRLNQSKQKKRNSSSPDILKEASNSILNQIENKGINCKWKQPDTHEAVSNPSDDHQQQSEIWSVFSNNQTSQKSYASTMDYQHPNHHHSVDYNNEFILLQYKQRSQSFDGNVFEVRLDQIGFDPRTTIMIRNIPNKYTIKDLSEEIDYYFDNTYDFLYLPCDLKNQCNVGYGFINFVNTLYLRDFYLAFHNHKWAKFRSEKICNLTYARLQGLNSLIQHFENSKVLNQKEKKYRPIIKQNPKLQNLIKTQQQK